MAAQKAWYWLAAGVVALGLNSEYQSGGLQLAHRLADRSTAVMARVSGRAHTYVQLAKMLMGREDAAPAPDVEVAIAPEVPEAPSDVDTAALPNAAVMVADNQDALSELVTARVQTQLDCAKTILDKVIAANDLNTLQPKLERLQVKLDQANLKVREVRLMRAERVTRGTYACPRLHRVVVKVPQMKMVDGPDASLVVFDTP